MVDVVEIARLVAGEQRADLFRKELRFFEDHEVETRHVPEGRRVTNRLGAKRRTLRVHLDENQTTGPPIAPVKRPLDTNSGVPGVLGLLQLLLGDARTVLIEVSPSRVDEIR